MHTLLCLQLWYADPLIYGFSIACFCFSTLLLEYRTVTNHFLQNARTTSLQIGDGTLRHNTLRH
jgi:hypothetical protein